MEEETANTKRGIAKMLQKYNMLRTLRAKHKNVLMWGDDERTKLEYHPKIPGGKIKFVGETLESRDAKREANYMMAEDDTAEYVELIAQDMAGRWRIKTPKLVLSIISSSQYYKPWNTPQDEEDFQDGLMLAASSTEMWIIAEGLNIGTAALVGNAVETERGRRKILHTEQTLMRFLSSERLPKLTVIGVVSEQDLSKDLVNTLKNTAVARANVPVEMEAADNAEAFVLQLNSNMTHFFLLRDDVNLENFMYRLEMRLMKPVGKARRYYSANEFDMKTEVGETPLVGLLIQGGPPDINHVLGLLSKNVPVIVICGQGMAADILAFAFTSAQNVVDTTNQNAYIKTELLRRLTETFPDEFKDDTLSRNQCRDRIMECISYATGGDSVLLTLLDSHLQTYELRDLSKVILTAVLSSGRSQGGQTLREQLQWNLQLTIDWKRPDLALSEIYNKYTDKIQIGDEQFQQVLLGTGRQEFVELFLDRGFILHKYLNSRRLELLFEMCEDKAFFSEICLETILGEKMTLQNPVPADFISGKDCLLNHLLHILTGLNNLIDPLQLSLNASNDRIVTAAVAEQKALHALLYWAALTYNTKLVKILWCKISEPMTMALVMSTLHSRLASDWISDHDLQLKTKQIGIEFGKLAVKMLDLNYRECKAQAMDSLTAKLPDFANYSAVDIAIMSKNKFFISHPCCQKYAYDLWYGNIRIRKRKIGCIELPEVMKIFLSLFLILPTYYWIDIVRYHRPQQIHRTKPQTTASFMKNLSVGARRKTQALLVSKLYHIWIAPITQFWLSQIFYIAFLGLFAYCLSQPYCGEPGIHKIFTLWLIVLFLDHMYCVVARKSHCRDFPVGSDIRVMFIIVYTASIVLLFRVLHYTFISFTTVKFLLSLSLIYFFYYGMKRFYPVSQAIGPMLVNITIMVRKDLTNWLKMWFLTLISGAVAIHALLYPAETLDLQVIVKSLFRGIFALFMTEVEDLGVVDRGIGFMFDTTFCVIDYEFLWSHYSNRFNDMWEIRAAAYTITQSNTDVMMKAYRIIRNNINTCPHRSAAGYAIVFQYIFQCKLVYNTLIFAICSVTMGRTYQKVMEIWKYQFFLLVQQFVIRPPVPVPLVILMYPALLIKHVLTAVYHFFLACCPFCRKRKKSTVVTYNLWKALIKQQKKEEKIDSDQFNLNKSVEQRLSFIANEQKIRDRQISSLNDRLVELLNSQTSIFLMMERMKNALDAQSKRKYQTPGAESLEQIQHTHCRRSPYPSTAIRRFAVFDKYLPWEENYPNYDPPHYSRPREEFDEDVRYFVDPDLEESCPPQKAGSPADSAIIRNLYQMTRQQGVIAYRQVPEEDTEDKAPTVAQFEPHYNLSTEEKTTTGEYYTADRISWITKDDQPIEYTIDVNGAPRNPMGRTGLRGRGNLWRYGPNHMMFAIISRWKSIYNSEGVAQGNLIVGGKKVKEIMVVNNPMLKEDALPGGFVSGRTSMYSVMCEVFMRDILGEKDVPGTLTLDRDDMILFFRQFVSSDFILSGILGRSLAASTSFSSKLLYRGYMDDPNNTDNAWVEAEVWSFHYHSKDKFDKKVPQKEKYWRDVSPWMQLTGSHIPYVMEVAAMYYDS